MKHSIALYGLLSLALAIPNPTSGQADQKTLFFISNSHLDTQWNWDVKTTINEYIRNTMEQNFTRLDKYPNLKFNFEGAIRYMWMKEYYPEQYAKLKTYVQNGRWHISGCAVDANDVMVSSAESIMRNWLYANQFFKKEFGVRGGYDVMLPDCFGFSYALPSLARHCGFKGFHTAKLAWGSAEYDQLPPFGIWQGVDGSQIYAVYKPGAYDNHEQYNKNMANDSEMAAITANNYNKYGVAAEIRYVGPRSDRGGALQDNAASSGENTPYWLNLSAQTNGAVKVRIATPDEIFDYLDKNKNQKYHVKDGELPMRTHGVGSYTSRTMLKLWNRRNELLADATEKSASLAQWLGVQAYPQKAINDAWVRNLWQSHHDGITGTSIPNAYLYSMNDYVLVNKTLGNLLKTTTGNIVRAMDTQTEGMPVVVYNPLSFQRTDIVEARLTMPAKPEGLRVFDKDGKEVLSQISSYDEKTGEVVFLFAATVPSLGYAVYDVRFGEQLNRLGVLRMDVDNLGLIFQGGLDARRATLSHYAALSRAFDIFFSGYINTLWGELAPTQTFILYSGGDDLFIVGRWDKTIEMAEQIQADFKRYGCHNPAFSISGGITIVPPKFPLMKAAALSADEESRAKGHVCGNTSKDAVSLLSMALHWKHEYPAVRDLKDAIVEALGQGVPKSFISKVLQHASNAQIKNHRVTNVKEYWMLTYDLSRMKQRCTAAKQLVDCCLADMCNNSGKLQKQDILTAYHPLELWALACRWAEIETRTNL